MNSTPDTSKPASKPRKPPMKKTAAKAPRKTAAAKPKEPVGFDDGPPIDAPAPMDPTVPEDRTVDLSRSVPQTPRVCNTVRQLASEVQDLFPEVTVVFDQTQRVTLDVFFEDYDTNHESVEPSLPGLLNLIGSDPRVQDVVHDPEDEVVFVSMRRNPRTQDSRDSFGLQAAYDIIVQEGS